MKKVTFIKKKVPYFVEAIHFFTKIVIFTCIFFELLTKTCKCVS
jgi:hypothetical protein